MTSYNDNTHVHHFAIRPLTFEQTFLKSTVPTDWKAKWPSQQIPHPLVVYLRMREWLPMATPHDGTHHGCKKEFLGREGAREGWVSCREPLDVEQSQHDGTRGDVAFPTRRDRARTKISYYTKTQYRTVKFQFWPRQLKTEEDPSSDQTYFVICAAYPAFN